MPTKPTSIRLSDRHSEWLARHGRPMSTQLRDDLDALRALYETADRDEDMTLQHATSLLQRLQEKGLFKIPG